MRARAAFGMAGLVAGLVLLVTPSAARQLQEFSIAGEKLAVPVADGFCIADERDVHGGALPVTSFDRFRKSVAIRAMHIDCAALDRLRAGRPVASIRLRMVGLFRMPDGQVELSDVARLQFRMTHLLFQSDEYAEQKAALVNAIVRGIRERDGHEVTCHAVETDTTTLGGNVCLEVNHPSGRHLIHITGAGEIVAQRLVVAFVADANPGEPDPPDFHDATDLLYSIQPVQPE